jgi:hypothetical protein
MAGEHGVLEYVKKVALRKAMAWQIAPLVSWGPMERPEDGYTVLVGCNHRLGGLLLANLRMLGRQRRENLREVIFVIDGSREELGFDVGERAGELASGLTVREVHYNERQRSVSRRIDWGWVYAWLSWCIGISHVRTRHAILHDFDALLLDENVLEERYRVLRERGVEYLGIAYHEGGGVSASDRLVRTFELMFDASFVREHNRPIDLFNTMRTIDSRRVEFDTFLNAQFLHGTRDVLPIREDRMVHPSQMICQFVDFTRGRPHPLHKSNLLMIPYYNLLGGDESLMLDLTRQLEGGTRRVRVWGRELDLARLTDDHRAWMRKQALRMELALEPSPRAEVTAYFDVIDRACASASASHAQTAA